MTSVDDGSVYSAMKSWSWAWPRHQAVTFKI